MEAIEQQFAESVAELKGLIAKRDEEIKNIGSASTETKTAIDNFARQHAEQAAQIKALQTQVDAIDLKGRERLNGAGPEVKTFGQRFVEHEEVQRFAKYWHRGATSMDIEGPLFDRKTTITESAVGSSTPGILVPERVGGIVKPPQRRLRVRDLIPWGTTANNAIEFVKENVFTNAASPQTEANDKAESALTFTIDSANVQTIAHWIPATRQVLDDFAQLQAYVDQRLLDGLADIEDYELLRGSGVGIHLKGITVHATAVAGTYAQANDSYIDEIAGAITELEANNYVCDGVVVHPADWRTMNRIKDESGGAANKGMYVLGGPANMAERRLWDVPLVATTAMPVGKFLVGQFAGSVQGFDRMRSRIDVSTEHSDYFIKNMVAIRAEERLTIAVFRPAAFRYGTFS